MQWCGICGVAVCQSTTVTGKVRYITTWRLSVGRSGNSDVSLKVGLCISTTAYCACDERFLEDWPLERRCADGKKARINGFSTVVGAFIIGFGCFASTMLMSQEFEAWVEGRVWNSSSPPSYSEVTGGVMAAQRIRLQYFSLFTFDILFPVQIPFNLLLHDIY